MVREFATVMGQEPNELMALDLVYEEWAEFREAEHPLDDLKELADLIYVLYGYANVMGYDLDEAVRRVHKNNIERCIQADGTVRRRQDGKILKRTDAPKVNLEDLV
jgi:predicted HAD superfamily Cof-like phosphohydrolase